MKLPSGKQVGEALIVAFIVVSVGALYTAGIQAAEREIGFLPDWTSTVLATALLLGLVPFQKSRWMVALIIALCVVGVGYDVWDRSLVPPPSERTLMSCVRVVEGRLTGLVCREELR